MSGYKGLLLSCRDVRRVSPSYVSQFARNLYVLPTNNLKVDLPHINVGELSAELETVQDIAS